MAKKNKKKETMNEKTFRWIRSLNSEKIEIIRHYTDMQLTKEIKATFNIFNRCMSAAIINTIGDNYELIDEIKNSIMDFLIDDNKKMAENKILYGGIDMVNKKIKESELEIKNRIRDLIDDGVKQQNELVKKISLEFPIITKAMATNYIKEVKSENRKEISREEGEKMLLDIIEGNTDIKEEAKKIAEEVASSLEEELEIQEIKGVNIMKLKIKKVELEGEFGSYIKEGDKVISGEMVFNSLEEVEEYQRKEIELFNRRMEELKACYSIS